MGDEVRSGEKTWQPMFYAVCAFSTAVITVVNYVLSSGGWFNGFTVGFGAASTLALLFLAAQHWSLATGTEVAEYAE